MKRKAGDKKSAAPLSLDPTVLRHESLLPARRPPHSSALIDGGHVFGRFYGDEGVGHGVRRGGIGGVRALELAQRWS